MNDQPNPVTPEDFTPDWDALDRAYLQGHNNALGLTVRPRRIDGVRFVIAAYQAQLQESGLVVVRREDLAYVMDTYSTDLWDTTRDEVHRLYFAAEAASDDPGESTHE